MLLTDAYRKTRRAVRKLRLTYHCSTTWGCFHWWKKSLQYGHGIDLWNGNIQHGQAIMNGFFFVHDQNRRFFQKSWADISDIFCVIETDPFFASYLCCFAWLRDLKATGDMSARRLARRIVEFWINNRKFSETSRTPIGAPSRNNGGRTKKTRINVEWQIVTASKRLSSWTLLYDFFGASAQDSFKELFFAGLQAEYRFIKSKFTKPLPATSRIFVAKALLEYNVYWDYDDSFFELLLFELSKIVQNIATPNAAPPAGAINGRHAVGIGVGDFADKNRSFGQFYSTSAIFDIFCTFVEMRNAMRQWEKSIMQTSKIDGLLFNVVFEQIQNFLHQASPLIRFFRHSNGTLCFMRKQKSGQFFIETPSAGKIDMALSQVDSFVDEKYSAGDVIRFDGKQSTFFVDLNIYSPKNSCVRGVGTNFANNCFNFEWSVDANNVILENNVMLFQPQARVTCVGGDSVGLAAGIEARDWSGHFKNDPFKNRTLNFEETRQTGALTFNGLFCAEVSSDLRYSFAREIRLFERDNMLYGRDAMLLCGNCGAGGGAGAMTGTGACVGATGMVADAGLEGAGALGGAGLADGAGAWGGANLAKDADALEMEEADGISFGILQFVLGKNLKIIEIKHTSDTAYVFYDFEKNVSDHTRRKQKKKERLLFVVNTTAPFSLKSHFFYEQPTINVWYEISKEHTAQLNWSFQILK